MPEDAHASLMLRSLLSYCLCRTFLQDPWIQFRPQRKDQWFENITISSDTPIVANTLAALYDLMVKTDPISQGTRRANVWRAETSRGLSRTPECEWAARRQIYDFHTSHILSLTLVVKNPMTAEGRDSLLELVADFGELGRQLWLRNTDVKLMYFSHGQIGHSLYSSRLDHLRPTVEMGPEWRRLDPLLEDGQIMLCSQPCV